MFSLAVNLLVFTAKDSVCVSIKSPAGSCYFPCEESRFFHSTHHRRLSCSVMPADLFSANFLKGTLEPTILYMGQRETGSWGKLGRGLQLSGHHSCGTKGSNRYSASNSGHTLPSIQCSTVQWTRGGRETVRVCITGSYSLYRGRDGNAESVKLHESLGEGGRG